MVTIHHTAMVAMSAFTSFVTYDVLIGQTSIHYAADGTVVDSSGPL